MAMLASGRPMAAVTNETFVFAAVTLVVAILTAGRSQSNRQVGNDSPVALMPAYATASRNIRR